MTRDELSKAYKTGIRAFENADLRNARLTGAYLEMTNLSGANLSGANLTGAYLRGANLNGADLRGANLNGADLGMANLNGADLRGAYLNGVYLNGADLGNQWIIQGSTRSDGYSFYLTKLTGEGVCVKAGCHNLSPDAAVTHWKTTRGGTPLGEESLAIVAHLLDLQRIRGLN